MLNETRKSLQSAGGLSKRSVGSKKPYRKLDQKDADEIEMQYLDGDDATGPVGVPLGKPGQVMKPHEIYENTSYIANSGLRLLEIPMNSSLTFQKLLWFHATYDIIFTILILGSNFHRVMVRQSSDILMLVVTALLIIWVPVEFARLRFGYSGNINETFPELIAFLIFTVFFIVPLSIVPLF